MKFLNPFTIDLGKTTLIEASAGTGKTYTITTLYCRLVAQGYGVESILVVTFTEAAAAELKLRIRTRLSEILKSLEESNPDREDDLTQFFQAQEDIPMIRRRLLAAINCFDQASVMTIHSFCLKCLKEHAFESGSPFDIELLPDRSLFLHRVSHDFFMGHVNDRESFFLTYLRAKQVTPAYFMGSFGSALSRADLVLRPGSPEFQNIGDEVQECLEKIHRLLCSQPEEIISLIQSHKGIDKRSYSKKNLPAWLKASLAKLDTGGLDQLFIMEEKGDALYKFTRTRIAAKTKSGEVPPAHAFFDLCETLLVLYRKLGENLIHLKHAFFEYYGTALETMKETEGSCFFDDLVNDLAAALEKKSGGLLKKAVRETYRACLIDEFQDTDPRQYDIFARLFASPGTPFFMIGDPKQAIYAFRGGDIFAYLKASKESDQQFTLARNYRSAPLLVRGINEVFLSQETPFLFEAITFTPVSTPDTALDRFVKRKTPLPPLQFSFVKRDEGALDRQGYLKKESAHNIIPAITARDILSLLVSEKRFIGKNGGDNTGIMPNDIAVLVRTNRQAEAIQNALSKRGIPSCLSKTGSVFDSKEALDLHDILWAVYHPGDKGLIKAALCTGVFHFSWETIAVLDMQEPLLYEWQEKFWRFRETWESRGFVSMIMALFHSKDAFLKEDLAIRERALTNYYHLAELMSGVVPGRQISPNNLLKWYSRQLSPGLRDETADELRLESDKKAVTIVTIHKSKGLEYPVVYLPYLWEGERKSGTRDILFHDPQNSHRLTLDFGSDDSERCRELFQMEEKAEQRRLLYVALTRASALCRIIWGGFASVGTSALGSLLHEKGCREDETMMTDLKRLEAAAPKSILASFHTDEETRPFKDASTSHNTDPVARKRNRDIRTSWEISSFSALTRFAMREPHTPGEKIEDPGLAKEITLARFPKGAGAGDFFHAVFEILDFTAGPEDILALVRTTAQKFGFSDPLQVKSAAKSIGEVLKTGLFPGENTFSMDRIPMDGRFNEMEFTFDISAFKMEKVQKAFELSDPAFKNSGYPQTLSKLHPPSFKGFLKGFIDLVFQHQGKWYILDYKSNYLGDIYDSYSQDDMLRAMSEHHYFLQYHLYLVALHRYLTLRLENYDYDKDFGGVFYLFIRGMHPEKGSGSGVFFHRPEKDCITCLSDQL